MTLPSIEQFMEAFKPYGLPETVVKPSRRPRPPGRRSTAGSR
ncbi:hypothetical protein [Mycolicibacterium llatzerense]|nr:hypothetical protein [Mycolicibacterium llatzerense]